MAKHENLKALFTAIANSIRNKTGGTDAIIADDFPEAIDGIQAGGGVDKVQRYIELNGNSAANLFYQFQGTSVDEFLEGVDTSNVIKTTNMFAYCKNLTHIPLFDTGNVKEMSSMFTSCEALTTVPLFDTKQVTAASNLFYGCTNLTIVPAFDFRSYLSNGGTMFTNCKNLTECWIRNIATHFIVASGTSYGYLLTVESLLYLCKECRSARTTRNFTMGTTNLAKLEGIYVKLIDITDEMRAEDDLIDEKYPFIQCESTDEGAMTIQEYMATKMWSLA